MNGLKQPTLIIFRCGPHQDNDFTIAIKIMALRYVLSTKLFLN